MLYLKYLQLYTQLWYYFSLNFSIQYIMHRFQIGMGFDLLSETIYSTKAVRLPNPMRLYNFLSILLCFGHGFDTFQN